MKRDRDVVVFHGKLIEDLIDNLSSERVKCETKVQLANSSVKYIYKKRITVHKDLGTHQQFLAKQSDQVASNAV